MTSTHSSQPLRAAVIGTGKISEEHLKFLGNSEHARLVGVCDLSPSMAAYAGKRFKAEKAYTDYAAMLSEAKPDIVHILTPPASHVKLITDCLNAGCHVVSEKPITLANGEFQSLWQLAKSKNLHLIEDHNYRFNRPIQRIEQLVRDGKLGEVKEVEIRMVLAICKEGSRYADEALSNPSHALPAGVIHEFITHYAYLLLRFMPTFDRVQAHWDCVSKLPMFKYDDLDAIVTGPNGTRGRIRFSACTAPDTFTVIVRGTEGWAYTDLFQPHMLVFHPRSGGQQLSPLVNQWVNGGALRRSAVVGFWNKVMQNTPYEGLGKCLEAIYSAIRDGREPPITYDDIDKSSRLVDALIAQQPQSGGCQ